MRRVAILLATLACLVCVPSPVFADTNPVTNKGLFVSPLRDYIAVDANNTHRGELTVANYSEKPIDIALSVEQFSVSDYAYDYTFTPPHEDWVKLGVTSTQLQPGKSQRVPYTITVPSDASPGGHYFTIFASASLSPGSRVQAAAVLYVTVNGDLKHSSEIIKEDVPFIAIGNTIPYKFDIKNTGNDHFFIFLSGQLEGLTAKPAATEPANILLPNTTRTVTGKIPAPVLPGVYKITIGYKTDGNMTHQRSKYIIYVPPWFIAIPIGLILILATLRRRRLRRPRRFTDS